MKVDHVTNRIDLQKVYAERIREAYPNLIKVGLQNISRDRIETRLAALKEEWERFSLNHDIINLALPKLDPENQHKIQQLPYLKADQYSLTSEHYLEAVEKMSSLRSRNIESATRAPSTLSNSEPLPTTPFYQGPRLPRINLKRFNGNLADWLPFRDLFNSLVVANPSISAVEKLQYLKTSLVGSAASLIQNTALTSDNFQKSWDSINSFYDNRRQLINSALDSLFAIKAMTRESAKEIELIHSSVLQVYRTLESLRSPVHEWDHILVYIIVQRLDSDSVKAWEHVLGSSRDPPTWKQFQEFLMTRMLSLQAFEKSFSSKPSFSLRRHPIKSLFSSQFHNQKECSTSENSCPACSAKHYVAQCQIYQQKTPQQRSDFVNSRGICANCLGYHQLSNCRSTRRCRHCGRKHHTSLHRHGPRSGLTSNAFRAPSISQTPPKQINHVSQMQETPVTRTAILLPTARVKVLNKFGESILIRALLDQGSEISLASQNLIQRLRIHREPSSVSIVGIGAHRSGKTKGMASLTIKPYFDCSTEIIIQAHVLSKLTSVIPSVPMARPDWPHLKGMVLADPDLTEPGTIDLIIGANIYGQLLEGSVVKGPVNSPTAQGTKLGWVISGPSDTTTESQSIGFYQCSVDHDLHSMLERFWQQEEIHVSQNQTLSSKDRECENHFSTSHSRDANGRYIVRLPFKTPINQLGSSKPSALRMLNHLSKRFKSNSKYFEAYTSFLKEYELLRHMNRVDEHDLEPNPVFYLPHHGVVRESSSTTKLRVVFNDSCKVAEGIPLNEALHSGPKCQMDLFDVLIWLRQFRYMFSSDVEKMYRQIQIHPDDWKFQRILWKEDEKVIEYELTTVTYGLACAPFLALRSILQLVKDEGQKYPLAVDTLLKGRYVDDVFGGADSIEEAQQIAHQVNTLCMAGGFPLRKWISNHREVIKLIPSEHKMNTNSIPIKDQLVNALGISWNPSLDIFQFKCTPSSPSAVTKRDILSKIAQFFDPLGLLSPLFIKAKIFMQELWAVKLQWDDCLAASQLQSWQFIIESMAGLDTIQVPRWMGTTSKCNIEIHGFSDASQLAMAALVYVRTTYNDDDIRTSLLCSKTKVAPLKRLTIPRLELSAAVLLSKLTSHCLQVLNLSNAPCHLWTDSSIVHTWINNHPSRWKDFIHNRVCFIQETLPRAQWKHVPGIENPADCATRGLSAIELQNHALWWKGPSWLSGPPSSWPNHLTSTTQRNSEDLEEKPKPSLVVLHTTRNQSIWDLLHRYSSLNRLLKITVLCNRAIHRFQKKNDHSLDVPITPEELHEAEVYWIRAVQRQNFANEINFLTEKRDLPKSTSIIKLFPFTDHQGLLRVGGRLRNSALSATAKHPYILPQISSLSTMIVRDAHHRTLHGSTQETLSYIRHKYWILGGRKPVRSLILKCIKCTRYRRNQAQQLMGQLPATRVTPSRAFLHTGVDYAGPFVIKSWKGRTSRSYKAWIALFVCFSTSAIHLEIVTDYSTNAFIAAYKRFTARRGICRTLQSDCGTNFKGSDKELQQLFFNSMKELDLLASIIAHDGTKWNFNPPAAPHFGGKWEAGVKSMKYHLRRVVGDTVLTYEEFSTLLCQIEAILNSRPLCPVTNDPDDLDVLTPGHFLIGQALILIPEPSLQQIQSSRLSRWQHICQMTQSFWSKWSKEYLQRHQAVYKWFKASSPLSEGSLVLITDERYPPSKWPLGRILTLHLAPDGIARIAKIKTSSTTVTRPIVKLCPLDTSPQYDSNSSPGSPKAGGNV